MLKVGLTRTWYSLLGHWNSCWSTR